MRLLQCCKLKLVEKKQKEKLYSLLLFSRNFLSNVALCFTESDYTTIQLVDLLEEVL